MSETTTTPTRDEDDLATLLAKREHARPNRVTWALIALLLVVVGFAGGAFAYDRFGPSTSSGLPSFPSDGLPNLAAGGFPGAGAAAGSDAAATSPATTVGTVKLVDGRTLYVSTGSDSVVIVTVPDDASVTTQKAIALSDLAAGTSVTVTGATGSDGKVAATSVSAGVPATTVSSTAPTSTQGAN